MTFFPFEQQITREHAHWNSLYNAITINSQKNHNLCQIFANFGSKQDFHDEADMNSIIEKVSEKLSYDAMRDIISFMYSDSIRSSRTANSQRKGGRVILPNLQPVKVRLGTNHKQKHLKKLSTITKCESFVRLDNTHRRTRSLS